MKSYIKIIRVIFLIFITLGEFILSLRLIINCCYRKAYTEEDIVKLITENLLLSISLLLIIVIVTFFIIYIFLKLLKYFERYSPLQRVISECETYYKQGKYDDALAIINAKSKSKYNRKYQYAMHKLAASICLLNPRDERLCNQNLIKALNYTDSADDIITLDKVKFQLMINSGSINGASEVLDDMKKNSAKPSAKSLLHLEALLLEKQGELENARSKLISAVGSLNKDDHQESFTIYNNLGRISGLFKNFQEQELYYEKAKDVQSNETSKYQRHVIYQNLIGYYQLLGNRRKCISCLSEYSSLIDNSNKYDLLEYYNFLLKFYRQSNQVTEFLKVVELEHQNLYPLLSKEEQLAADIYELQFMFNNSSVPRQLLEKIESNFSLYKDFNLYERLNAYHVIFQSITAQHGEMVLHPFESMHRYIYEFFRDSFSEINMFIKNEVDDFQVYKKCWLLEKKVMLYNFQQHDTANINTIIQKKLKLIEDITDCYSSSGNIIPALESLLNYIDECMGSWYNDLTSEQKGFLKEQMFMAFDKADKEMQQFLKHIEMPPLLIRMAKYSSFLDRKDLAKKYLNGFRAFNISINHFSSCIQMYYNDVIDYTKNHC